MPLASFNTVVFSCHRNTKVLVLLLHRLLSRDATAFRMEEALKQTRPRWRPQLCQSFYLEDHPNQEI